MLLDTQVHVLMDVQGGITEHCFNWEERDIYSALGPEENYQTAPKLSGRLVLDVTSGGFFSLFLGPFPSKGLALSASDPVLLHLASALFSPSCFYYYFSPIVLPLPLISMFSISLCIHTSLCSLWSTCLLFYHPLPSLLLSFNILFKWKSNLNTHYIQLSGILTERRRSTISLWETLWGWESSWRC